MKWLHYFWVTGRARRTEFWLAGFVAPIGLVALIMGAFVALVEVLSIDGESSLFVRLAVTIPVGASWLAAWWLNVAASIRRLHDLGRSGWCILALKIPVVGFVLWLYIAFAPSVPKSNVHAAVEQ